MAGIFGGAGAAGGPLRELECEVLRVFPDSRVWRRPRSFVAAHAIPGADALYTPSPNLVLAADRSVPLEPEDLRRCVDALKGLGDGLAPGTLDEPGVVGLVDEEQDCVVLASDWSGAFPMYYAIDHGTFLFSTLLRPLRVALRASVDAAGVASFLRLGHHLSDRTLCRGIHRLLPGQVLRYSCRSGKLVLYETSRAWASNEAASLSPDEAAEAVWLELVRAMPADVPARRIALMMSAGWDSRTLLAAALERGGSAGVAAYSHGDLFSRELDIVRSISRDGGIACQMEPIGESCFEPAMLAARYADTEAIQFPQWHHAAQVLAEHYSCVTAGVFGEVLGGHYGPAMLLSGIDKIAAVGASIAGVRWPRVTQESGNPLAILASLPPERTVPWMASAEMRSIREDLAATHVADIARTAARFRARGILSTESLVEAFVTEHRGAQLISSQLLCMRGQMRVALPFARPRLLALAAGIPLSLKMHNRFSQRVLRRAAPWLLRYPSAATLVASSSPILLQEASRLARRTSERIHWGLHRRYPSRFARPHHGWMNFDFLRTSDVLLRIRRELRSELWDHRRLDERMCRFAAGHETISASTLAEGLLRAYSVELALT